MILCIDIGGTKTALAVCGKGGEELFYKKFATEPLRGAQDLVERIYIAAREFPLINGIARGAIASPGPLDAAAGMILDVVTMGWKNVPIAQLLEKKFSVPFCLINDCDAGALGVWKYGGYSHCASLAYFSVSTGVGGGLTIGGKPYAGQGNAANFGHIRVSGNGKICGCGKTDCLELYASGLGIERRYFEQTGCKESCAEIAGRARKGERVAQELFTCAGEKLAQAVSIVTAVADPEEIVFGGSVCLAKDLWLPSFCANAGKQPQFAEDDGKQVLRGALQYALSLA